MFQSTKFFATFFSSAAYCSKEDSKSRLFAIIKERRVVLSLVQETMTLDKKKSKKKEKDVIFV